MELVCLRRFNLHAGKKGNRKQTNMVTQTFYKQKNTTIQPEYVFGMSKAGKKITKLSGYLSIRFISCRPSPFRKRSRLELSIRQEQRESNRFSIISCSSAVLGLCRLNTCMTKKTELPQNRGLNLVHTVVECT